MNIMLCCSAGLSTSIVCSKMRKYSEENGLGDKIWATSLQQAKDEMLTADIVLIGPHMRAMGKTVAELAEKLNVPCMIIDQMDYAYGNAKAVYTKMQKVLENKKG